MRRTPQTFFMKHPDFLVCQPEADSLLLSGLFPSPPRLQRTSSDSFFFFSFFPKKIFFCRSNFTNGSPSSRRPIHPSDRSSPFSFPFHTPFSPLFFEFFFTKAGIIPYWHGRYVSFLFRPSFFTPRPASPRSGSLAPSLC